MVQLIPYYIFDEFSYDELAPYWREFSKEDLTIKVAFLVSGHDPNREHQNA